MKYHLVTVAITSRDKTSKHVFVTQTSSTDANLVKQTGIEAAKIQFPHDTSYEVVRFEETGKCVLE